MIGGCRRTATPAGYAALIDACQHRPGPTRAARGISLRMRAEDGVSLRDRAAGWR